MLSPYPTTAERVRVAALWFWCVLVLIFLVVALGLAVLNKAVELKPDYFDAMFYLGLMLREKAKSARAIDT